MSWAETFLLFAIIREADVFCEWTDLCRKNFYIVWTMWCGMFRTALNPRADHRTFFRWDFLAYVFSRIYFLSASRIFTCSSMSDSMLSTWRANTSKVECIAMQTQETSASHLKYLKFFEASRHSLAVDSIVIRNPRMFHIGGKMVLSRCTKSKSASCSVCISGSVFDTPNRWSNSNRDPPNNNLRNILATLVFEGKP